MKNTLASLAPAGKAAAGTRLRGRIPIRWFSAGNSSSELKSSIRRSRWWISAAAGALMLWPGESRGEIVAESASTLQYRQTDAVVVSLPKHPRRTVIGYGSLAGVWHLAGGKAVGVPRLRKKSALPEEMRTLPKIGTPTVPNVEKIVAMKPDLVLLTAKLERHRATAELLRESGIPALCVEYGNYNGFHEVLDLFCRINGTRLEDRAEANARIREVRKICAAVAGEKAPRCAIVFAASTGFTLESSQTNTGCMAALLGAENVRKDDFPLRSRYSYERLLLDDPDVILIVTMGEGEGLKKKFRMEVMERAAWKTLSAAGSGRVHFLPVDLFLYMPGPRYPEAFRYLAKLLYPRKEF